MSGNCKIEFNNVSLIYDLYYDKTTTLKEYIVNLFHRRQYGSAEKGQLYALKDVNVKIDHGERVGIIGLNGSGKSTFLKIVAGLLKPSSGSVDIVGSVQPLIEIGAGFNPEFSGRDNLYLNGAMLGFTRKEIREKEDEIIEFSELREFIEVPVKYYSSGMAMRLAFTIATLIRPEILVMDEMLSAGDMEFIQKARDRMDRIVSSAKLLVIVSHDMGLIKSLATRVLVINNGMVLFDGDTDDAIEFYTDLVVDRLDKKQNEQKLREEEERKRQESEAAGAATPREPEPEPIKIGHAGFSNSSRSDAEMWPEDDVVFSLSFTTEETFDQFFINLVISDKAGVTVGHLRNDFADIELNDFAPGAYSAEIPVYEIPFKSGRYKYYFRLVGVKDRKNFIKDSETGEFTLLGNKKQHRLIKHEWVIKDGKSSEPVNRLKSL